MKKAFFGLLLLVLFFGCTQQQGAINNALDENAGIDVNAQASLCGNSRINAGETCASCAKDVKCASGEQCSNGKCEKIETQTASIGEEIELAQGGIAEFDSNLSIKFIGILVISGEDGIINKARLEAKNATTSIIDLELNHSQEIEGKALTVKELNAEQRIVKIVLQEKALLCGNNVPDAWENCSTCSNDVVCVSGQECIAGQCVEACQFVCCSNADCNDDKNTTTDTCLNPDTNSARCQNNTISGQGSGTYVEMLVSSASSKKYYAGDSFSVIGKGEYSDDDLSVRLDAVVQLGGELGLRAKFSLLRGEEIIDSQTIAEDTELQFYDALENEIMDTYVFVETITRIVG